MIEALKSLKNKYIYAIKSHLYVHVYKMKLFRSYLDEWSQKSFCLGLPKRISCGVKMDSVANPWDFVVNPRYVGATNINSY